MSPSPTISIAALFTPRDATLMMGDQPEQIPALGVPPSFFPTLGRSPCLGRPFTDVDATLGASTPVILTDALWTSRFGGDPGAVGRHISVNGESRE